MHYLLVHELASFLSNFYLSGVDMEFSSIDSTGDVVIASNDIEIFDQT